MSDHLPNTAAPAETLSEAGDPEFTPEDRALCPDDACIGVLDHAGICKECGRHGAPAVDSGGAAGAEPPVEPDLGAAEAPVPVAPAPAEPDEAGEDFADRRLCTDPSCIGLLDSAGRCKECGRADAPGPGPSY